MASDLPYWFKDLSLIDRKLFLKTYDIFKGKNISESESFDKALFAVGKTSSDLNFNSLSQNIDMQTAIVKESTGLFNSSYFFDATLSSTTIDDQNESASSSLLKWLDENGRIEEYGDIKHYELNGVSSWKGLFKLVNHYMDGEKLKIKAIIDKSNPNYKEFLKMHKETPFTMLSAEFKNPKKIGNKIVYANKLGWTLTTKGSNPDSKIEM